MAIRSTQVGVKPAKTLVSIKATEDGILDTEGGVARFPVLTMTIWDWGRGASDKHVGVIPLPIFRVGFLRHEETRELHVLTFETITIGGKKTPRFGSSIDCPQPYAELTKIEVAGRKLIESIERVGISRRMFLLLIN